MSEETVEVEERYFEVGGTKYKAIKTGFAQAEQVSGVARWLGKHGKEIFSNVQQQGKDGEAPTQELELVLAAFEVVSPQALVSLFDIVVGCGPEKAKKYFDIEILIDGVMAFFEQPSIRRVIDRFFTTSESSDQTEES